MTNLGSRTGIGILGCELLFRRKECAIFLNSVVKLDSDLKGKFIGPGKITQYYKSLSRFVYMLGIVSAFYPIFGPIPKLIKNRHHRQYWGSQLLPRSIYDHTVVSVLFILYEVNITFANAFAVGLTTSMLYCYMQLTELWLETVENGKFSSITVPISMKLKIFSSLKILNILQNEIAAPVLWPTFENTLLAMQVVIHVANIRFLDDLQPGLFFMQEIVLGFTMIFQGKCIKSGAKMGAISTQFKKTVRRFGNKFEKKVAKSLHPLRVNVGQFYCFKKSTFMTFLQAHVDTTISWLLTLYPGSTSQHLKLRHSASN
ncbi:hypothetical protein Fcan01_16012 [Folsomia candida]|uniref:Uncharacterized protein n=1 Tax=Folsomia candida TaxID=158441 RepID=A0A226DXA3_FOLCA|nr:hypothetical protein Fcan01_16012 [Folsomia candida]